MHFPDRSLSSNQYVHECLIEIEKLVNSSGLSEFSDKYFRSCGYPCFLANDPSLKLLWVLVGGDRDEHENTVFRYLESDSIESEVYKLGSLTLGNTYAAGDASLLKRYVSAYSLLLDIALEKVEGRDPDLSTEESGLISRFIDEPSELVHLGKYDPLSHTFTCPNPDSSTNSQPSSFKARAFAAGYLLSKIYGGGVFSEELFESLRKENVSNGCLLHSKKGSLKRLAFKTLFYERIVQNIYKDDSSAAQPANWISLKISPQGAKYGCIKRVSVAGRSFEVSVPPNSKNGTILRLKGVGANDADILLALSFEDSEGKIDLKSNSSNIYNDVSNSSAFEFKPSIAIVPAGRSDISDDVSSLINSLSDPNNCIQSFFNDLAFISQSSMGPSLLYNVLHVPPFDEALYASLVKEMHRYTLAELYDKRTEMTEKYSHIGSGIGFILGLMTGNIVAPFVGTAYGRSLGNFAPKGKKLEEILPDPHLLFAKDQSSFTAMIRSGSSPSMLRRLIFHRIIHSSGHAFFRVIPALVSSAAVIPAQVFRCSKNAYFMRPVNAGLGDNNSQVSYYSPVKVQRQYYHLRGDGQYSDTGERLSVVGDDIDGHRYRIYRHSCDTRELDYFYIDYASDPSHIF